MCFLTPFCVLAITPDIVKVYNVSKIMKMKITNEDKLIVNEDKLFNGEIPYY